MFLQFKKLNNESGVVLFIVLMTAIIIMILSVGILTQSMNETNYAQQQIDQIVSDQLAKGIFWNAYSAAYASGQITTLTAVGANPFPLNGRTYTVSVSQGGSCPAGQWCSIASYDTF